MREYIVLRTFSPGVISGHFLCAEAQMLMVKEWRIGIINDKVLLISSLDILVGDAPNTATVALGAKVALLGQRELVVHFHRGRFVKIHGPSRKNFRRIRLLTSHVPEFETVKTSWWHVLVKDVLGFRHVSRLRFRASRVNCWGLQNASFSDWAF